MTLRFPIPEYRIPKSFDKLSETTVDLLHLINKHVKKQRLGNEVIVHLDDDQLQIIEKDACGMYQILFYLNLFNRLDNSSILNEKNLNKRKIEELLNEIFSIDRQEKESGIKAFAQENNMLLNPVVIKTCSIQQSLFRIVDFRQALCSN